MLGATPAPTPDEIYVAAVAEVRALQAPPYVTYRLDYTGHGASLRCVDGRMTSTFDGHDSAGSFRVSFRTRDETATTVDSQTRRSCAGVPLLAPTGGDIARLVEPPRGQGRPTLGPVEPYPDPAPGSVRVVGALHYRIDSAKLEALDGVDAYHLTLRAIADPDRYPLTDLWIDPASYAIRRVRGTFSDLYGDAAATIVGTGDFRRFGNAWVLVHEHVDFEAATSPHATHATLDATAEDYAFL